ncbi:putative minor head protein [Xanthomonas phage MET13-T1]|nr:putative minor head protein [Xanthomonas phage MET13-T1]
MPKTANEEILDATVRHQIRLLRFSQGEAQKSAELLAQSDAELVALLQSGLTDTSEARIRGLLTEVRRMRAAVAERIQVELEEDMEGLSKTEAEWEVSMLQGATPIALSFNAVPATVVKAVAGSPINGIPLQGWLGKMATNDVARIEQQIRLGVLQGETIDQMVRRIRGTKAGGYKDGVLETTRREAEMIARTATNHVSTAARQATWDANADVIKGVRWVATLDGRTSPVCQSRDGEVYPIDKGPRPPAHPNCRSTVAPVLHGEEIVGDRPTVTDTRTRRQREIDFRAEAKEAAGDKWKGMSAAERNAAIKARRDKWADENIGQTPTSTNYQSWLKGQSKEFQDEVLGKGKAQLFRDGLPLEKFVDEKGKPYSLAELKAELEGDKLNVIQPGVGLKAKSLLQQGMSPSEVLDQIKKEFPDASTSAASIASYKSELNKAGALNLGPASKVPAGALKQAKAVADVVADLDASLPPNLKHAVGGQWSTVVDDLDGSPGAYGYYQAGKGVVLSGKKLSVLPAAQAKQVAAHELGHLLHKQHDLLLDPDVLAALKASAKGLSPDARKLYSYYLTSADELVAEVYGQALSPSAVTSQGLSAIEFNKAFGPAIQAAKDAMAKKFPVPPAGAKVPLPGGPALPYEVAGKHTSVGSLAKALLQQGMPDDQVLKAVLAEFPEAQTKQASIASYKSQLKKDGLLPNKASGPVVAAKPIPDVVPVPSSGAAAVVAPEAAATQSALTLTSAQLKDEAIKLMQKGMLSNQDLAETLAKQFPANAADVKVTNIATWKSNWKKSSPNSYNHAVSLSEKATVKEAVSGPVQKPKLADQKLGGTSSLALDKVKSVLAAGGGPQDAYEAMKSVFGVIKQPGADDLLELAQYQLASAKAAGKPYLNAAFTKPTGFVSNGKIEKFTTQLPANGKAALEAYKKAKQQGLGPINTNKLVKKMAGYEPSATMKVKLKEAAEYELKKQGTATVSFNEATVAKKQGVAPTAVDMTASRPASTPRDGLPPPPRYSGAQRAAGVRKFANGLPTGDLAAVNAKQRSMGLQELTAEEVAAVKAYTGNTYRVLNNALRAGKYSSDPHLQAYVDAAQHGMSKMPKFQGVSSRGMTFNDSQLKAMLSTYRKGVVVEDSAFVSSSYGEQAAFSGNVYMRINGKTGVNVSQYSYYKTEREVLFMPGTRFRVDDVVQQNGKYIITVTEV